MRRLLAMVLLTLGCASIPGGYGPAAPRLRVTNNNWNYMRVYADLDGVTVRIGNVETGRSELLTLKPSTDGVCAVALRPLGSNETWNSGTFECLPGEVYELRIQTMLATSMVVPRGQ